MRVLLDTNALLWWFAESPALSKSSRQLIADDDTIVFVSAASAWEICTKVRIGKLETARGLSDDFSGFLQRHAFLSLAITIEHARLAGRLVSVHKDPFDRMLAAQAIIENVPLITNDTALAALGATTLW